jgi:hypothetical protein
MYKKCFELEASQLTNIMGLEFVWSQNTVEMQCQQDDVLDAPNGIIFEVPIAVDEVEPGLDMTVFGSHVLFNCLPRNGPG